METKKIKATLTQGKDRSLTLRVWLSEEEKSTFLLESGKLPKGMVNVVVMNGREQTTKEKIEAINQKYKTK